MDLGKRLIEWRLEITGFRPGWGTADRCREFNDTFNNDPTISASNARDFGFRLSLERDLSINCAINMIYDFFLVVTITLYYLINVCISCVLISVWDFWPIGVCFWWIFSNFRTLGLHELLCKNNWIYSLLHVFISPLFHSKKYKLYKRNLFKSYFWIIYNICNIISHIQIEQKG